MNGKLGAQSEMFGWKVNNSLSQTFGSALSNRTFPTDRNALDVHQHSSH